MTPGMPRPGALRRWHRRIGIAAALFVVLLALSGVVLNHPGAGGLDQRKVHSALLARWYGLEPQAPRSVYRAGAHRLAWANGTWLLDGRRIAEDAPTPVGMVQFRRHIYIATSDALFEYGPDYALVEKMSAAALPAVPIRALGAHGERLFVRGPTASFATGDRLRWERAGAEPPTWSTPQPIPAAVGAELAERLVPGISLQQLLADMHSGRILGRRGPWIVDFLALSLAFLALTGTWLFARRRS
jgi:hypothetical protein